MGPYHHGMAQSQLVGRGGGGADTEVNAEVL